MAGLTKAKHTVSEIDGVRCSIVETGCSAERITFLKDLLTLNHFEVKTLEEKKENEGNPTLYTLGVTDIIFNPIIAVYERSLRNQEGFHVCPGYWNQQTTRSDPNYWKPLRK